MFGNSKKHSKLRTFSMPDAMEKENMLNASVNKRGAQMENLNMISETEGEL